MSEHVTHEYEMSWRLMFWVLIFRALFIVYWVAQLYIMYFKFLGLQVLHIVS